MKEPLPTHLADELHEIAFRAETQLTREQRYSALLAQHPEHADTLRAAIALATAEMPTVVGPFRIVARLGEGGFGTVYRAQQTQGVDRTVALKVLRAGVDSRTVLARFELERQVLASMSHDSIARFYEAGQADGQPWFSMELVEGEPLTDYCDRLRLSIRERVRLLLQLCDGVQHAHGKGIVHRDLKPGNVLVSSNGDSHAAKIIDFGIARATDRQLSQSMQTMVGSVIGTPEYMAPEQCGGDPIHIDARTDVYALGVMLYELLTAQLPFAAEELPRHDLLAVQKVLREKEPGRPSTRIATLGVAGAELAGKRQLSTPAWRRAVRGDLDAIVGRAMEKDQARRYQSAADFAADLRRHLDYEPIVARPPSRVYRVRKFVRRYRGQVAAAVAVVVTAVIGAAVSMKFAWAEQRRAGQNEQLATSLNGKVREFDQLKAVVLNERVIASEQELHPPWPHKIEAMQKWLREDCGKLLAMQPEIKRTVKNLEQRRRQPTAEEAEADGRAHPDFAELERLLEQVESLRRAQAIRAGAPLVVPELTAAQQALDAVGLHTLARERVAPDPAERSVCGDEPLGLAAARAAVQKAAGTAAAAQAVDTLAWALVANGQDEEGRRESERACTLAPAGGAGAYEDSRRRLDAAVQGAAESLRTAEAKLDELRARVNEPRLRFVLESERFLHDELVDLLAKLASLEKGERVEVEKRLVWANRVRELTQHHPNARHTWDGVRAAIAANPKYAARGIELREGDVIGLVPIGENPVTGLWEFYDLRSAWNAADGVDPVAIEIPQHAADGGFVVAEHTGIVFVLLPGGTFTMGSQHDDPLGENHDLEDIDTDQPPNRVSLAPFFIARHELTQAQWMRLGDGSNPSRWRRGGPDAARFQRTLTEPVETISWVETDLLLRRHGMQLPTEAQWEYAARGGTTTPWCFGTREDLAAGDHPRDPARLCNVADQSLWDMYQGVVCEPWRDGHAITAPVDWSSPNNFGLCNVHGNVREWCQDWKCSYATPPLAGSGLRDPGSADRDNPQAQQKVHRGGGFYSPAVEARCADRMNQGPERKGEDLGVRAARALR